MTVASAPTTKQHTCDVCGRTGQWTVAWSWWGSIKDQEEWANDSNVLIVCSRSCRDRIKGEESTRLKAKQQANHPKRARRKAEPDLNPFDDTDGPAEWSDVGWRW